MKINNLFNVGVYAAPSIEVAEFSVEQGFAASGVLNAASDGDYGQNDNGDY